MYQFQETAGGAFKPIQVLPKSSAPPPGVLCSQEPTAAEVKGLSSAAAKAKKNELRVPLEVAQARFDPVSGICTTACKLRCQQGSA